MDEIDAALDKKRSGVPFFGAIFTDEVCIARPPEWASLHVGPEGREGWQAAHAVVERPIDLRPPLLIQVVLKVSRHPFPSRQNPAARHVVKGHELGELFELGGGERDAQEVSEAPDLRVEVCLQGLVEGEEGAVRADRLDERRQIAVVSPVVAAAGDST